MIAIKAHLKDYLQLYEIIFIPLIFSSLPIALRDKVRFLRSLIEFLDLMFQ